METESAAEVGHCGKGNVVSEYRMVEEARENWRQAVQHLVRVRAERKLIIGFIESAVVVVRCINWTDYHRELEIDCYSKDEIWKIYLFLFP